MISTGISTPEGMNGGDFYTSITGFRAYEPVPGKNCRNPWNVHQIDSRFRTTVWQEDALAFAREFKEYIQQVNPQLYQDYFQPCLENLEDACKNGNFREVSRALECLVASIKFKQ